MLRLAILVLFFSTRDCGAAERCSIRRRYADAAEGKVVSGRDC